MLRLHGNVGVLLLLLLIGVCVDQHDETTILVLAGQTIVPDGCCGRVEVLVRVGVPVGTRTVSSCRFSSSSLCGLIAAVTQSSFQVPLRLELSTGAGMVLTHIHDGE
jgi:hypothetical protein